MEKETYRLMRYRDAVEIGASELTPKERQHYVAMSDRHIGTIRLGAMPHAYYSLDTRYQDTSEDTVVYIEVF